MSIEVIVFLAMLATFIVGCFAVKLPVSVSMMASASVGALVGGQGIPLRHLVEGTFSYVDTILVIATAMIFMKVVEESGALEALSALIIQKFYKVPALLLILIMLVIMFPGMVTGSSTAAVLSAGSIMAPVLIMMGIPKVATASIIAMGGLLGMIAPPTNIPAMIIGGGIDMPYVGFEGPLALLTFPLAFLFVLMLGYKYVRHLDIEAIRPKLNTEIGKKYGFKIYLPIILVLGLMVVEKVIPAMPDLGTPLIFLIGAVVGQFTGKRMNPIKAAKNAVNIVLPVMGILMGVGMFIQIMTLTGVRGLIVTTCLSLDPRLLYVALAISIPLFGAVSSFGASSVLGVPFLLALLSGNQIVTAAAISLIASLGDMMPPTALAGLFAAQVVGEPNYLLVLKRCIIPALILIVYALLFIVFSNQIGAIFGL
ncbi:MAG: TRAP transporter large permease subunit [Clostridia bacterium]